jgi:hypothetical protein
MNEKELRDKIAGYFDISDKDELLIDGLFSPDELKSIIELHKNKHNEVSSIRNSREKYFDYKGL